MTQAQHHSAELRHIPLHQLSFDPENPRLPVRKRDEGEEVLEWMLRNGNILELMLSIAVSGYSDAEPLLATPKRDGAGYIVVEGNRRLAALKLLANPALARLRKKSVMEIASTADISDSTPIPALVYPKRADILDYLGYRHITGIKPWGSRQKAEYLKQLLQSRTTDDAPVQKILEQVAEMIGSKAYYARKLLTTLAVVELAEENAFWGSEFLDRIDANFSVLHTALSYENIRAYIGLDESADGKDVSGIQHEKTKDVLQWVCGNQKIIKESRELKRLNAVIGNDVALKKLKGGLSLEIAAEYTGESLEDFRTFLNIALTKLTEADRLVSHISDFPDTDESSAKDVARLAKKIYDYVRENHAEF
ncbi:MAG: hypothetical protein LBO64_00215 [Desulfovibrio sp.]|nr:hypothetical protein [Desulfovibrio sp.]